MPEPAFADRAAPAVGMCIVHRRYVDHGNAHYAGNLASGGFVVGLFNDIATDLCIHVDGDEGLFAAYSQISFHGPLFAGDVLEVSVEVTRVGRRSRTLRFEARALARSRPVLGETASGVLVDPLPIASATGTVVVPAAQGPTGPSHD